MNKNLGNKDYKSRDEFYTTRETAERMLENITTKHLQDKVVYCNCDGPESEIYKLLKERFNIYKMKLLIATKYVSGKHGVKTSFDGVHETIEEMSSDGSYNCQECEDLLNQCDVVITNPPFSKLGDYIPFVMQHNVDVVLIVNMMAMMYKNVLPYVITGRFCCNNMFSGGGIFTRPNSDIVNVCVISITTFLDAYRKIKYKYNTVQQLKDKGKFIYADGTQTLELKYIRDIPIDYDGEIYVPITILLLPLLRKWFDIVRFANEQVSINGKNRFHRVVIKHKADVTIEKVVRA